MMTVTTTPDVLIIGGGINGIGIARELAFRGISVVVVEKNDLCSGTSSQSSKLVHGGIRYLEHGNFSLVADACVERYRLINNAPHLVVAQPFYIPIYKTDRRRPWIIRMGLYLYELLSIGHRIGHNKMVSIAEAMNHEPRLQSNDLIGVAEYYDGKMDDARLGIETAIQAHAFGTQFLTYATVTAIDSRTRTVDVDREGHCVRFTPKVIVNAAGPWADSILRMAGPNNSPLLRMTKGSHITTKPIVSNHALLISAASDNRVIFVIPHEGYTLIGTTDTPYSGDPSSAEADASDIRYLVDEVRRVCDVQLQPDDIYSSFAGIRPLVASTADTPAAISRDHRFIDHGNGMFTMTGGKYTTFRSMSEDAAKAICRVLGQPFRQSTTELKLPYRPPLTWPPQSIRTNVHTAIGEEFASQLLDIMRRRSDLFFKHGNGLDKVDLIATEMATFLGKDTAWIDTQIAGYRSLIAKMRATITAAFQ